MSTCPNPINTFVGDAEFRAALKKPDLARWLPGGRIIPVAVEHRHYRDGRLIAADLREATDAATHIGRYGLDPVSGLPVPVSEGVA